MALTGEEDEILSSMVANHLEMPKMDPKKYSLDPVKMQVELTTFLSDETAGFMKDLWEFLQKHATEGRSVAIAAVKELQAAVEAATKPAVPAYTAADFPPLRNRGDQGIKSEGGGDRDRRNRDRDRRGRDRDRDRRDRDRDRNRDRNRHRCLF